MKKENNIQVINLSTEEVNLFVINELLYSISSLEIPSIFRDTLNKLRYDISNYLFPLPNSFKDKEAYEQKWSITTFFSN